jgi:tetratricopeptide (TPR) repeat protein
VKKRIIYVWLLCISFTGNTQNDSITKSDSLVQVYAVQKNRKELHEEQRRLNFEKFFFQALSERAIDNYDKAIIALEKCQNIRTNDLAVNFELSKNYFSQELYIEAISYANKALDIEPENTFVLEHLKDIYVAEKNYKKALEVQQKIVVLKPLQQEDLVILYIRNNRINDARNVLLDLENKGMLSDNLIQFKQSLMPSSDLKTNGSAIEKPYNEQTLEELRAVYSKTKSYAVLKEILTKQYKSKNYNGVERESEEGITLFPAQPTLYLIHAKALNKLKKYNKAVTTLQNGIDYVIDDYGIEASFYEELGLALKGLGKNVESSKYYNLALETRKKTPQ